MIGGDEPPSWDHWLGTLPLLTSDNWPVEETFVVFDGTAGTFEAYDGTTGSFTRPILVARTKDGVKQLGVSRGPIVAAGIHKRFYYDTASQDVEYIVARVRDVFSDTIRKSGLEDVENYVIETDINDILRAEVQLKILSLYQ